MSTTSRYLKYGIIITVLLLMLVVKFAVLSGNGVLRDNHSTQELSVENYKLHADNETRSGSVRDVFLGTKDQITTHRSPEVTHSVQPLHSTTNHIAEKKIELPVNVNEQVIPSQELEIDRVKLLGIVFHDKKKKAFMALDKQRVIADVGDMVYGRYYLNDIAINSVELVDTKDNQRKTIKVSGK